MIFRPGHYEIAYDLKFSEQNFSSYLNSDLDEDSKSNLKYESTNGL